VTGKLVGDSPLVPVALSRDGGRLVTVTADLQRDASGSFRSVQVWNTQTQSPELAVEHRTTPAYPSYRYPAVALSLDGRWLAGEDLPVEDWPTAAARPDVPAIKVYKLDARAEHRSFSGLGGGLSHLTFSADGRYVAASSRNGSLQVWDLTTG